MSALELFADVEGIPQDDGPRPVCGIHYPEEYRRLMEKFRAVMARDETSSRVLDLTADLLEFNAAHYTVWYYRRRVLDALEDAELYRSELEYAAVATSNNPKNYQVWYHRRAMLEKTQDAADELEFVAMMLEQDAKNYHAWSHRLWALQTFPFDYEAELAYADKLLTEDVLNNSAWNHRQNVVRFRDVTPAVAQREVAYAVEKAFLRLTNESPWTYALAFARRDEGAFDRLSRACDAVLDDEPPVSVDERTCARVTRLELLADRGRFHEAADCADTLANTEDAFRVRYWTRRAFRLRQQSGSFAFPSTRHSFPAWAPPGVFPFGPPPDMPPAPPPDYQHPLDPPTPDDLRRRRGVPDEPATPPTEA
mmetsp:Transcript_9096/g.27896  ORF Transcript_9096/g.27896 Transcript_9096/m.27896 type:complete len:366 (+) Transcript_9096:94-1191(+)